MPKPKVVEFASAVDIPACLRAAVIEEIALILDPLRDRGLPEDVRRLGERVRALAAERRSGRPWHGRAPQPKRRASDEPDRPSRWIEWARKTFGEVALDPRERALRFAEEAVELAQAMDIAAGTMKAIVARVYGRPAGAVPREIGQCLGTLELLARVIAVDAEQEAAVEFARVQLIPQAEWDERHAAKVSLGIAEGIRALADPQPAENPAADRTDRDGILYREGREAGVRAAAEVARRRGPGINAGWVAGEILKLLDE